MTGGSGEDVGMEDKFETLVEANDILLERVVSAFIKVFTDRENP